MTDKEIQEQIDKAKENRIEKIKYLVKEFKNQFYNNSIGEVGRIFDNLENKILYELDQL